MRNRFDVQLNPSRLIVPSQTIADQQLAQWLDANDLRRIVDGDGAIWAVQVVAQEFPDPQRSFHQGRWQMEIKIQSQFNGKDLVAQGVLDAKADERLLALVGLAVIPMHVRPVQLQADTVEEARLKIGQAIVDLKQKFQDDLLRSVKKDLLSQWLNARQGFGERPDVALDSE